MSRLTQFFDTKVDSTFILRRYLKSDLQLLVLFSSVAGRYGNRGQGDYAAANEVMNRFAWQMQQEWSNAHVVAINWGPWDSPGMANEVVKQQFIERGVIPISVAAGRQFFADELRCGLTLDVEVIAGEAPWEQEEAQQGQWLISEEDLVTPLSSALPFISTPVQLQPNSTVTLEHTFSLANDPYLQDHCLDGKPVVPAAVALEWIAEFVQSAWPEWVVAEIHELKVLRGLVLEENGTSVLFSARAASHADAESLEISVEILDSARRIPYYCASVVLKSHLEEESAPTNPLLPLTTGKSLNPTAVYEQYLFHGQRFQLLTEVAHLNDQGIDGVVQSSQPRQWLNKPPSAHWLFDPGVIDTAPQIAIAWLRVQQNSTPLPTRFGKVMRYGRISPNTALNIAWRVTSAPTDSPTLTYDAVFYDAKGKVYLLLQDVESTSSPALNRLANKL